MEPTNRSHLIMCILEQMCKRMRTMQRICIHILKNATCDWQEFFKVNSIVVSRLNKPMKPTHLLLVRMCIFEHMRTVEQMWIHILKNSSCDWQELLKVRSLVLLRPNGPLEPTHSLLERMCISEHMCILEGMCLFQESIRTQNPFIIPHSLLYTAIPRGRYFSFHRHFDFLMWKSLTRFPAPCNAQSDLGPARIDLRRKRRSVGCLKL